MRGVCWPGGAGYSCCQAQSCSARWRGSPGGPKRAQRRGPPQAGSPLPHHTAHRHRGTHRHHRTSPPGTKRTTAMPHRRGPDHGNATSTWFGGADRRCCRDGRSSWGRRGREQAQPSGVCGPPPPSIGCRGPRIPPGAGHADAGAKHEASGLRPGAPAHRTPLTTPTSGISAATRGSAQSKSSQCSPAIGRTSMVPYQAVGCLDAISMASSRSEQSITS